MAGFKEILKHGRNYLIANLATKALAFISIPVYTRILSTEDYGVVSIFIGVVGILSSIFTLGFDQAISRYYFDQKNKSDFKRFVGTSSFMGLAVFLINSIILISCSKFAAKITALPEPLIYLLIPTVLINIISLTFEQIYGPMKKSKQIAISSLLRVYLGFGFSIIIIIYLRENKYYGHIIGQIIAGLFLIIYWIKCISPYFSFKIDTKHIKYILSYSIPLIPYALSGVLIEQFAKITIGSTQSLSDAGFYSLALSISGLVAICISIAHQAWNPYYFEYMNTKNYIQHDHDQSRIFRITLLVAVGIACFGGDLGRILAPNEYSKSFYLIPIFTIGWVFYQLAYVYMRNFGFSRKTIFSTVVVFLSGGINIVLNSFLIPQIGELGAAISFVISYIFMAISAWWINKYLIRIHGTAISKLLKHLIVIIPAYVFIFFIFKMDHCILSFIFRFIIVIGTSVILFWKEREQIRIFIKNLIQK